MSEIAELPFESLVELRTRKDIAGEPETLTVSHSSLSGASCRRRFMYYKILQMSRRTNSLAGGAGQALHNGYQKYLITGDMGAAIEELLFTYPYRYCKSSFDPRSVEACLATLRAIIEKHDRSFSTKQLAQIEKPNGEIVPAVEVPFEIRLFSAGERITIYDRPVSYTGYIDEIFRDIEVEGKFSVEDLKTTGKHRKDYTPMWLFEEQTLPYQFVLSNILGAQLKEFETNIICAFIDILEPRVQIIPLLRTADNVKDWARGLLLELYIIRQCASHNWWPRNGKQCDTYGICNYFDICQMSEARGLDNFLGTDETGAWPFNDTGRGDWEPYFILDLDLQE